MGQHWSQKKGVVSGQEAQRRAASAARSRQVKAARAGKGAAPEYRESRSSGCPLSLVMLPWLLLRALFTWLAGGDNDG